MRHRFTTFLLMLCICWQSLAHAGAGVLMAEGADMVHAALHFEGKAHHHDGHDGAFHLDESSDSTQHAMDDACGFAPALLADLALPLPAIRPAAPVESLAGEPPLPFLRGLERPPKPRA